MNAAESKQRARLLIVFLDLTRWKAQSDRVSDEEAASTIDAHYAQVSDAIGGGSAGGRVVKFIGDATLAVFPPGDADAVVRLLMELKRAVDADMRTRGWECRLSGKVHVGSVVEGLFGPADDRRYDVIGRAVNAAAMLPMVSGLALSAEAFELLSPSLQREFERQNGGVHAWSGS